MGSVVRIPFGRQTLDGVVVGLAGSTEVEPEKLVSVTAVRPQSVPPELVDCALWMAAEYCSTPARALGLVLPPKGKARVENWWSQVGEGDVTERQAEVLARLPGVAGGDLAVCGPSRRRGW